MRTKVGFVLVAGFGLILAASAVIPVYAHHAFNAQYDRSKPITLTGPVTKIDWINPHARFFMDAKDANGATFNWELELAAPAMLMRRGWTRTSLKVGAVVTVSAFLAKDGSKLANASTVTLSTGEKVFAGSSAGDDSPTP